MVKTAQHSVVSPARQAVLRCAPMYRQRVLLILVLAATMFVPRAWALSPEIEARIDALARQTIADGVSAGVVVGVGEQGKRTFERGYGLGNVEWHAPATPDTVFRVGSITKQFAAVGVLLLAEQKKLSLDDQLARYFPDYPRGNEVTLRQLLNHTAGVHSYPGPTERTIVRVGIGVPDMVKHLGSLGYDYDPGTRWEYSNSGYFLIGAVIEQVSGQTFREFARQRLFEPPAWPARPWIATRRLCPSARARISGMRLARAFTRTPTPSI